MRRDTGGPAFPVAFHERDGGSYFQEGMQLRDYFAGQALLALVSLPDRHCTADEDADAAYVYADSMIRERAKKDGPAA